MSEAADALTPYSRRHLSVLQAGVTVLVIGALLALGAVSVKLNNQMRDTRARWASFDDAYTRHGQQLEALRGALGYEGFIHHFKNYVLRGASSNRQAVQAALARSIGLIEGLAADSSLQPDEVKALSALRHTLDEYAGHLDTIAAMHRRRAAPAAIDAAVRVDDGPAAAALDVLTRAYRAREKAFMNAFAEQLVDNAALMTRALPGLLLLAVLGALIVVLIRRLARALTGLEEENRRRQRAEARIAATADGLKVANEELQQFAYVASHDLRAPLRGIETLAGWIAEDVDAHLSDEGRQHMRLLRGRIARLDQLLQDLLAYSRLGKGLQAPPTEVDTGALVRGEIELLNVPDDVRIEMRGDWPVIRTVAPPFAQVMRNLISNAVKHRADGGTRITVHAEPADRGHRFTVEDDGPGIPMEYQDRVFGMFQTLRPRDSVEGSGMGLALVRKIVRAAGGSITLTSPVATLKGKPVGCRFEILWPDHIEQQQAIENHTP